jgi:DNA-directed RNA polymerase specialized sigma24 family protein
VDDPEGSRQRFTELYDENYGRVLAYVLMRTESHAAEDVVSETFFIAWRRIDDIREPALPWLIGVARDLLLKQRDSGFRRRALAGRITAMSTDDDLTAWDVADFVVERDSALAAMGGLSDNDLELLSLVMWHGLAPPEAANVVGCSTAQARRPGRPRRRSTHPPPRARPRRHS